MSDHIRRHLRMARRQDRWPSERTVEPRLNLPRHVRGAEHGKRDEDSDDEDGWSCRDRAGHSGFRGYSAA